MNTQSREDRIGDSIERALILVSTLIIVAAPICSIWALGTLPAISMV